MGDIASADGNLEKALGVYEQMQKFGAQDPALYKKLCSVYVQTNNVDKAKITYARLEKMSPNYEGLQELKAKILKMESNEKG